jgi:predicted Zn-dependent protease with MMP-like domain
VHQVTPERFEELVSEALDAVPEALLALLDNVVVMVEDRPPAGDLHLLGRYEGVPLTERGTRYSGVLPDRISIYRLPILAICRTDAEVVREVNITVVHEIAHHFGIDDVRLHELGYG